MGLWASFYSDKNSKYTFPQEQHFAHKILVLSKIHEILWKSHFRSLILKCSCIERYWNMNMFYSMSISVTSDTNTFYSIVKYMHYGDLGLQAYFNNANCMLSTYQWNPGATQLLELYKSSSREREKKTCFLRLHTICENCDYQLKCAC